MKPARKTSSNRAPQEKENAPLSIDYNHILRLCLKYWPWLAGGVILGVLGGYFYALAQTPIYSATSTIDVQSKEANVPGMANIGQTDTSSTDLLKTKEQLLQTRDLLQRVVKSDHLNEDPDFLPKGVTPPVSEDTATDMLAGSVTIRIRPLTRLIDITVEHPSPKMAQILADRLAQESVTQQFDQHVESTSILSDYLQTK